MRRTLLVLLILSLTAVPVVGAQDEVTPVSLAASWLAEQQAEDGSFADDPAATAIAAIALASIGEPNAAALAWLEDNFDPEDDLSLLLIAASFSGEDAGAWLDGVPGEALVGGLRNERGGDMTRLCFGLVAMEHMGEGLPLTAIAGLKALQNDDGGFPASSGGDSDIPTTALCVHTLQLADEIEARDEALAYIASQQNEDGGWGTFEEGSSDALTTSVVLIGLNAVGEEMPADAVALMESFQDRETGMVTGIVDEPDEPVLNTAATAFAILALGGHSFNPSDMAAAEPADTEPDASAGGDFPEGPALDDNWALVSGGFEAPTFDTADDFFVTVVDPFTDEELYGVEIINWTAEYEHTGYIVENFLPGEVLLFMAEQDPSVWENISVTTLQMLPPEELAKLPEDVQARAAE